MSFELVCHRGRTNSLVLTLFEADDNGLTLNSDDKVRFKVWRRNNATPVLDIDSIGALSGGSIITVTQTASAAEATLKLCQADTASLDPGVYSAEISVVDSGDSNLLKCAEQGQFLLLPSGGGDIGAT